jgi:hypothetical protein
MKNDISDVLRDILRKGEDVLRRTPETDPDRMFLHTLVNYARAKRESEGAIARIREIISIETHKPLKQVDEEQIRSRFVNQLHRRFEINLQRAKTFFEVLREDAE